MRRFITYIYEYEQGNRGRNTGFIRTDLREKQLPYGTSFVRTEEGGPITFIGIAPLRAFIARTDIGPIWYFTSILPGIGMQQPERELPLLQLGAIQGSSGDR